MITLFDLNRPVESFDAAQWDDAPLDTLMQLVARRAGAQDRAEPADTVTPPDDDALVTWEDAEWQ